MMGFYSVFASVSGQILVAQLAFITYARTVRRELIISPTHVAVGSGVAFAVAFFICLLPDFGVGSFAYSGEGFCYIDWSNGGQVIAMELVTVPTFALVMFAFISSALTSDVTSDDECVRDPPTPARSWWWVFLLAYTSAWILWIPAAFIGMGSDEPFPSMFPTGYMIAGGVLGHMQALINPLLYGVLWRSWFLRAEVAPLGEKEPTKDMSPPVEGAVKDGTQSV